MITNNLKELLQTETIFFLMLHMNSIYTLVDSKFVCSLYTILGFNSKK